MMPAALSAQPCRSAEPALVSAHEAPNAFASRRRTRDARRASRALAGAARGHRFGYGRRGGGADPFGRGWPHGDAPPHTGEAQENFAAVVLAPTSEDLSDLVADKSYHR